MKIGTTQPYGPPYRSRMHERFAGNVLHRHPHHYAQRWRRERWGYDDFVDHTMQVLRRINDAKAIDDLMTQRLRLMGQNVPLDSAPR